MNAFMKRLEYLNQIAQSQGGSWKLEFPDGSIKIYGFVETYIELLQCSVTGSALPNVENIGRTKNQTDELIEKLLM